MSELKIRDCSWCGHKGILAYDACPHCTEWIQNLPNPLTMGYEARIEELEDWVSEAKAVAETEFTHIKKRISDLVGRPVYTTELATSALQYLVAELRGQIPPPNTPKDLLRGLSPENQAKFLTSDFDSSNEE